MPRRGSGPRLAACHHGVAKLRDRRGTCDTPRHIVLRGAWWAPQALGGLIDLFHIELVKLSICSKRTKARVELLAVSGAPQVPRLLQVRGSAGPILIECEESATEKSNQIGADSTKGHPP
jgi:hypothetical protein